ncbi:hypothetical protein NQ318_010789 [Aromia moschata]|uniref:Uncharacterized protein n=1 Tax=Aromia moschata TaxID=1265417 RepID=A0AAV8XCJ4_9CUCU|nr:hypothetical protein NQ318_010789 [Aromia moschata]
MLSNPLENWVDRTKKIGGSQGKFRPQPRDTWLKMKLSGKQPRLLPDVMQAIVDLKETKGSTQNKILEHIQNVINAKKITPRPRNITMQKPSEEADSMISETSSQFRRPRQNPEEITTPLDNSRESLHSTIRHLHHIFIPTFILSAKNIVNDLIMPMKVRRALKHGVQNGLLMQKSGKFQLGMRPKDFAVYKIFRHMEPLSGCGKCKKGRGRGRRGRRRRRRRRRRSLGENKSGTDIAFTPKPSFLTKNTSIN